MQLALNFTAAATDAPLELLPVPDKHAWKKLSTEQQWAIVRHNAKAARSRIAGLVKRGALFVVSHSGGKDSQAMLAMLRKLVPAAQLVIVHATLGKYEWQGCIEHIEATREGIPMHIAQAIHKDGSIKTLRTQVLARGMWSSPEIRTCTSDLKRGPIEKVIRRISKETGCKLIVSCTGERAEESTKRRRLCAHSFKAHKALSKAGRECYELMPIADWLIDQVWSEIRDAGQEPHWAYGQGMSRLSCCFCIMASKEDQRTAARLVPELYAEIVAIEKHIGHTMSMERKPLEQVTGIAADKGAVRRHLNVLRTESCAGAA